MSVRELFTSNDYNLTCENLHVDNVTVAETLEISGNFTTHNLRVTSTENSNDSTTGALIVSGGAYIDKDLIVNGTLTANDIIYKSTEIVTNTDNSTSTNSGALQVLGGAGIAKNLYVGGNEYISGHSTTYGNLLTSGNLFVGGNIYGKYVTDTTASIDSTSGGFVISGGASIVKNVNVGQGIMANSLILSGSSTSTDYLSGDLIVAGGVGVSNNLNVFGNSKIDGVSTLKSCRVTSTLQSVNVTSGALVVSGGIGACGAVNCSDFGVTNISISSPNLYGAVGNGLIDDTNALQSTITNNRNIILEKNKTYRITSTLTVPANTIINMNDSTILTNDGVTVTNFLNVDGTFISTATAIFTINGDNISLVNGKLAQCIAGFIINGYNNLRVDNLEIYYTGNATLLSNCQRNSLTNLYIHDNRRICLSLAGVKYSNFQNIKIYNPAVWGIYAYNVYNCVFDNVNMDYDTTYESFYGGGTGTQMNNAYLNKYYSASWAYAYGQKVLEHTAYTYAVYDSLMLNCDWSMHGLSTKIVNWSSTNFEHCKMYIYWTLPNTNGTGYWESVNMKFNNCVITGLNIGSYSAGGCKWDFQFSNCDISGEISTNNMNSGTGIYTDCKMLFNDCRITSDNARWDFGKFDGYVCFDNCEFYPNTTPRYCFEFKFNGDLANALTLMINNSRFYNSNSSYYPLLLNNAQVLSYAPKIYVNNCQFINCNSKAINNTKCNVECTNMNFEENLNYTTGGIFEYNNCVFKEQSIIKYPNLDSTNWYLLTSNISLSDGIFNINARSPTFNEQILNINGSSISQYRNNFNVSNSARIICAPAVSTGTVQIDYVEGHTRTPITLNPTDSMYQTFIPTGNFYLRLIYTLEATLGDACSFDYAIHDGVGTGGTVLISGSYSGTNNIIISSLTNPLYVLGGHTYTLWMGINNEITMKTTSDWYPSIDFSVNGVDQGTKDLGLYFVGATEPDAVTVYAKGLTQTEIISPNYDYLLHPFIDYGSDSLPNGVISAYYDSANMTNIDINDNVHIIETLGSTSTDTGALQVAGGVGVAENIYVGGNVGVTGSVNTLKVNSINGMASGIVDVGNSDITVNSLDADNFAFWAKSNSGYFCGNLYATGGSGRWGVCKSGDAETGTNVGSNFNIYRYNDAGTLAGTPLIINRASGNITLANTLTVQDTTQSTNGDTGSLVVAGGVGIGKNLSVGGSFVISNTDDSSATNNGAIVISGGVGIAKKLFVGDYISSVGSVISSISGTKPYEFETTTVVKFANTTADTTPFNWILTKSGSSSTAYNVNALFSILDNANGGLAFWDISYTVLGSSYNNTSSTRRSYVGTQTNILNILGNATYACSDGQLTITLTPTVSTLMVFSATCQTSCIYT